MWVVGRQVESQITTFFLGPVLGVDEGGTTTGVSRSTLEGRTGRVPSEVGFETTTPRFVSRRSDKCVG